MSDSSYRRRSRDDLRRYATLEVPSASSRRGSSRDSSLRGSTHELASSYRSERYLSVQPGSLDGPREASRDGRRRYSTQETSLRRPNPSRSPRPVDTSSRYRYTPLDSKVNRAIRVIRVHDELVDDKIACEIEQVTTDSKYTALSYTWGSSKDASETIFLNGHRFMVRRNLLSFLHHARAFHAGKSLWIDAICINQEDVREKNRQVQMMSKIYSSTAEVFVWLGPRVDYAGHCLRRMQAYESMSDTEMALSSSKDSDFWKGFAAINSARYWDRVWVIQEFIQSKHGRIIQGDRFISFDTFQNAIRRFDNRTYRLVLQYWVFGSRRNEDFSKYISNIHPLWQRRIERSKSSSVNADAKWALLSGNRFCMDIRDRVYGILPLSTHGSSLRVDYDLNPFELLLESIWLEHDTEMDRTELLMNLANILLLTPAAVCMYADHHTSSSRAHTKILHPHAAQIHLRAASSHAREDEWLLASSHGGKKVEWRNFARDQRHRIPEGLLAFPGREQCPWQMMAYTATGGRNVGLKLAVDTSNVPGRDGKEREKSSGDGGGGGNGRRDRERDRDKDKLDVDRGDRDRERDSDRDHGSDRGRHEKSRSRSQHRPRDSSRHTGPNSRSHSRNPKVKTEPISPQDFLSAQKKRALAYGIYNTTCAPYPLRIYYSLVEGLEDMGGRSVGGEGAFWGLDALEDLDLGDLDI